MAQLHYLRETRIWTCNSQIWTFSSPKLGAVATSLLKKRKNWDFFFPQTWSGSDQFALKQANSDFYYPKLGAVATSLLKNCQIGTFIFPQTGSGSDQFA